MKKNLNPRPFVFLNVAMTADGKISPANRHFVPFGSKKDHDLLLELRTDADAVMSGARTVDLYPVNLGPGGKKYRDLRLKKGRAEYNLRVVVSGSASLNPKAEIFKHRFSPIVVLTTERAPRDRIKNLKSAGAEVFAFGKKEVDFKKALVFLRKQWDVKSLLCEGGGEINEALLRAGLVQELYLTICPLILGGRTAPTLADGLGVDRLGLASRIDTLQHRRIGDELFLRLRVTPTSG